MSYVKIFTRLWKILLAGLGIYIAFAFLGSTLPYLISKPVSSEKKAEFSTVSFYNDTNTNGSDRIALIESSGEAFGIRIELLRNAKQSLDIVYHTINKGETSYVFLAEILKAADRGVQVRLLLDGKVGVSDKPIKEMINQLNSHDNISCRLYNPVKLSKPWT